MPYIPYQLQKVDHICPICGDKFVGAPNQIYDTTRCRAKADRLRKREREGFAASVVVAQPRTDLVQPPLHSPTAEQLGALCELLRNPLMSDKLAQITGSLPPLWEWPDDISVAQQADKSFVLTFDPATKMMKEMYATK